MKTLAGLAALVLLVSLPSATAQGDPTAVTLTVTGAGTVPYAGGGSFDVTVGVGCATLLQAASDPTAMVTVTDAPAWFTFTDAPVDIDPTGCVAGGGTATGTGKLEFTVSAAAPAVTPQVVQLQASIAETDSNAMGGTFTVAYKSSYNVTPTVSFPLSVTNKTTTFTVTGEQASNAPSMIMVDDFSASCGSVSGIGALQYNNEAGKPDKKTYTVTFTAPKGEWTTCTLTLKVYGHFNFNGQAGDPTDRKTLTWDITNGGVEAEGKEGGSKDSPAPVGAITALGLLGLAAVLRRKA